MSKRIITLNNIDEVIELQHSIEPFVTKLKTPFAEAVRTLQTYRETIDFEPAEALRILNILGINETETPEEMNAHIHSSEKAFVMRKKFFNSTMTKTRIESLLIEVVSELAGLIQGDILRAIMNLIKNTILICLSESVHTEYKELCFRFFTKDNDENIVILVINISYEEQNERRSLLAKLIECMTQRAKISFFGAIVKTRRNLIAR